MAYKQNNQQEEELTFQKVSMSADPETSLNENDDEEFEVTDENDDEDVLETEPDDTDADTELVEEDDDDIEDDDEDDEDDDDDDEEDDDVAPGTP